MVVSNYWFRIHPHCLLVKWDNAFTFYVTANDTDREDESSIEEESLIFNETRLHNYCYVGHPHLTEYGILVGLELNYETLGKR